MKAERPNLPAVGKIIHIREEGRLFDIEMANGYIAIAVLPKEGPSCPDEPIGLDVDVEFSPFDMSRSKIKHFHTN